MSDRPPAGPDDLPPYDRSIHFISKSDWGANEVKAEDDGDEDEDDDEDEEEEEEEDDEEEEEEKKDSKTPLKLPVDFVRFTTTGGKPCNSKLQCKMMLRKIQQTSRDKDSLYDVPYNFLVDAEGNVYEGRGWFLEAYRPEQYKYLKGKAIDIAYFGDFGKHTGKPTLHATRAAEFLVQYGVDAGIIKVGKKEIGYNN